jgi:hypothetical protein
MDFYRCSMIESVYIPHPSDVCALEQLDVEPPVNRVEGLRK